jgi:hypothetical protein
MNRQTARATFFGTAILLQACGGKAAAPAGPERIGGTVQSLDGQALTVATPAGSVRVRLAPSTPVATVARADRARITDGSFLGIGSVTQPDGSQRALEVTVFPEALRGTGEGSYAWNRPDVPGGGKMTNGTAGSLRMTNGTASGLRMTNRTVTAREGGASLTLAYKDGASRGSQTITVPPNVPVVALEPGQPTDLQPGVHVLVFARRDSAGVLTADRVLAGKNGLVPPM